LRIFFSPLRTKGGREKEEGRKRDEVPSGEVEGNGMETLMVESVVEIKPTDPLRLVKETL
jgi:hypothetical protein